MDIHNLLDNINIILQRKKYIESLTNTIPMLELYEYELKGYPESDKIEFGDLYDTPTDSCGIIEATNKDYDITKLASCDPLSSPVKIGGNIVYNIKTFYKLYKLWKAKEGFSGNYKTIVNNNQIENNIITLIDLVIDKNIKYIEKNSDIQITKKELDPTLELHKGAFIYKINVKSNEKVVIFGDFHGSFHTFLRNMFRLYKAGIIANLINYKITEGYKIIFLGDILDRGEYALEILIFVMNLIHANNTEDNLKVILNRGNHEEIEIASSNGFKNEILKKFNNTKIFDKFMQLMSCSSSAIILQNGSYRFWLSHGGVPIDKNTEKPILLDITKKIEYYPPSSGNYYSIPWQIRWNDFDFNDKIGFTTGRGYIINHITAKEFLKLNNIKFIIRGHQDNPHNSYLVSNNSNYDKGKKHRYVIGNKDNLGNIKILKKNLSEKYSKDGRLAIYGPIAKIIINEDWNDEIIVYNNNNNNNKIYVYPIITLSTNTDLGRNLTSDSFAILRFDLTNDKLANFDKETNIIDTRNDLKPIKNLIN